MVSEEGDGDSGRNGSERIVVGKSRRFRLEEVEDSTTGRDKRVRPDWTGLCDLMKDLNFEISDEAEKNEN